MKKIQGIIVGTGPAGTELHFGALKSNGAEILAFVDINLEAAQKTSHRLQVPHAYGSLKEALQKHKPDFVDICTTLKSHTPLAKEALEAGFDVLIEKPMTETIEQALELKALTEKTGKRLTVVHNNKFCPGIMKAKKMLEDGVIGEVLHVHREMSIQHEQPKHMMEAGHWTQSIPGGFLFEGNPHSLYLLYDLVGPFKLSTIEGHKVSERWPHAKIDEFLATGTIKTGTVSVKMSINATKENEDLYAGRSSWQFFVIVGSKGTMFVTNWDAKLLSEAMFKRKILAGVPALLIEYLKERFLASYPRPTDINGKPVNISVGSGHYFYMREYLEYLRGNRKESPVSWDEALFVEEMNEEMGKRIDDGIVSR